MENINIREVYKDYLKSHIKHFISVKDYLAYDWINKSEIAREDYITDTINDEWYFKYDDSSLCPIMADKVRFNTVYKDFIFRDWLFVESSDMRDAFNQFCHKHKRIVVKPTDGQRGDGVKILDVSNMDLIEAVWIECVNNHRLIEEVLTQGELAKFHPQSVNTVRISTAIDNNGKPHIMASSIRFGRGDNYVDNAHADGLFCGIDVETGMIISPGIDKTNKHYLYHPDTRVPFLGFVVPQWEELKNLAVEAAGQAPGLRYIGWDWVLCNNGKWELLEGNEPGNPDVLQLGLGRGLLHKYKTVFEYN